MEEKYFLLKRGRNLWYYQKGDKIYFYDESSRVEEVIASARIHPEAKEVMEPPQKIVDIFKKHVP